MEQKQLKYFLFVVLYVLISFPGFSQTVLPNNPPSLKWYQVNTSHFQVIYPKGFEAQAQRMANTLEYIHDPEAKTLGSKPKKISVILQNQSSVSNAFVSILPRRAEFYTMPSQDYNFIGTNDWLNLLASHEYRHVVQFQHAKRGFNKALYYLFGNTTLAGMAQVSVPQWFWEGDAVATETAFTPSGRGRIPNFGLVFKTNLMEGRTFNYHKQYVRSYKNNIPNHYVLGFHMVSYLRRKTNDPEIWGKITARTWNVPFLPFAFSNAIHKETGMHVPALYRDMAATLKKEWQAEIDQLQLTSFEKINNRKSKAYTDYQFPQALEDGSILTMKSGIGDIETFVLLKDGKEQKAFTPGFINDAGMLSVSNSKIVWSEYGYDPRWGVRTYSLIKAYDVKSKTKWVIGGKHQRLSGIALSPDGSKIVAVRSSNQYQTTLLLIDFSTGRTIREFSNTENNFYSMPRWSDDGKKIVVLKTSSLGKTISLIDVESGKEEELFPSSQENVGHPVLVGQYVYFNSPVSDIDNIYVWDIKNQKRYQVTSSKYGAYNPSISNDRKHMYYNEQNRDGLDVVKTPLTQEAWKEFVVKEESKNLYQHLADQEGHPHLFDSIPQTVLATKKYSKLKGLINPYSWGAYIDNDLVNVGLGISSRDKLSTTSITAGYVYDQNEKTSSWKAGISYQGWYPIIDVNFTYGNRSDNKGVIEYDKVVGTDTTFNVQENLTFKWKEATVEAGLRIPLITTRSKYYSSVSISNYFGYTSTTDFRNSIDGGGRLIPSNYPQYFFRDLLDNGNLLYNHFGLTAYRVLKKSRRDINSKWGQSIYLNIYNTPFGGDFSGKQFSVYGVAYFPGLFKHHSLWGYGAYQYSQVDPVRVSSGEGLDNYTFRNKIPLPRGQSVSRFQDFYSVSGNYTLPLWYPDLQIGPLLNIQRVRANLFFDYGFGSSVFPSGSVSQSYTSTGVEMKFDINIMRFLPQFDIGFRYSYGISPATTQYEVLIGTFNF
ncbi:MAG: hypothetical protein ABI663_18950 [Chryseolinea sp.]